jgi:hypothetical protein
MGEMLLKPAHHGPIACKLMLAMAIVTVAIAASAHTDAFAQVNPFATMRQPPPTGWTGWILAEQSHFYRALSGLIRCRQD